ncbi:alpha/beta fold hydrolase [Pelagibacterium xiamenense]|uniref:alpha/beta fold hydrolase n=1 Tax=Pelagibacterium xiamenense TaxID=2901140 RepID=UPI001E2B9F94|nr:alpha/beta hydrolase [Pelagibacterium xiamenense]MCD7060764.1 alpha/beta hydrolase [Pelagibacterium xiamenense]
MAKRATLFDDLPQFAPLGIGRICPGPAGRTIAVHLRGNLGGEETPLVCIPGYNRTMLDYTAFLEGLSGLAGSTRPVVLLDLAGRGRSAPLPRNMQYATPRDAADVIAVCDALGITRAVLVGQGHGGQVAMIVAKQRPSLVGGTVLIDSGPVTDPRGLVRLRNNFRHLVSLRDKRASQAALRKILAADYPSVPDSALDTLGARVYAPGRRGGLVPLFDPRLIGQIEQFEFDDVLEPQWPLFDCLHHAPIMLVRTQMSDQVRRETYEEMRRRRPDAALLTVTGQGSPALLDDGESIGAIEAFAKLSDRKGVPVEEAAA